MYKITKIINNNIVSSEDKNGNEVILRGLGIGFKNRVGGTVADDKIEKIYMVADKTELNKMQRLFDEIPAEYIDVSTEIIEFAESILGKRLNKNIRITLTDHIDFAIERNRNNINCQNALLSEIINFYPTEYGIGKRAVEMINEKLNENLGDDEAGFIALHIVNAELDTDMNNMFDITEMIQAATEIVKKHYNREPDIYSMNYTRFITHMKFFGQRLFKNKLMADDDPVFQELIRTRYKEDYACAVKIQSYISAKYNKTINEEELTLITIHLRRISKSN